ncbi:MAG: hypothetical protein HWD62_19500 [Cyclobacteriaceae bacterium]|nr:MAG: hypothetical protein HWD62_19500 [Cyclobacteriaceae bacterium]
MINIAFTQPDFGNTKLVGSYFKNFNKALFNWELNRQEDGQKISRTANHRINKAAFQSPSVIALFRNLDSAVLKGIAAQAGMTLLFRILKQALITLPPPIS